MGMLKGLGTKLATAATGAARRLTGRSTKITTPTEGTPTLKDTLLQKIEGLKKLTTIQSADVSGIHRQKWDLSPKDREAITTALEEFVAKKSAPNPSAPGYQMWR